MFILIVVIPKFHRNLRTAARDTSPGSGGSWTDVEEPRETERSTHWKLVLRAVKEILR